MKRYPSIDYYRQEIATWDSKGFRQRLIDGYHVQVLQACRTAVAFAVAIISVVEFPDKRLQAYALEVIAGCENILKDDSVYVVSGRSSAKFSKQLQDAVRKAENAVVLAGNFCNNLVPGIVPEKIHEVLLRARDICDEAMKWKRYS